MHWKKVCALLLSAAMCSSVMMTSPGVVYAMPSDVQTLSLTDGETAYAVDFSQQKDTAGWTGTGMAGKGAGSVTLENGKLKITSNAGDKAEGNVGVFNDDTPAYTNGYMEVKFQMTNSEGRIGFLIHADGGQNHQELIYDSSTWSTRSFTNGTGGTASPTGSSATLQTGKTYTVRLEVVDGKLTATQTADGGQTETICENLPLSDGASASGRFGFRAWGSDWGNTGDTHYGSMTVESISMGELESGGTQEPEDPQGEEYFLDFENTKGNWQVRPNGSIGTAELTSDGRFEVQTTQLQGDQYYLTYDAASPDLASGELSCDVEQKYAAAGRFSFVFRYKDANNWNAVGYDVGGQWKLFTMQGGKLSNQNIFTLTPGNTFNIRISFAESDLEVYIDDNQMYKGSDVLPAGENAVGKMGIRTWGYDGNYAHIIVDNMKYSKTNAVSIDPKNVTVLEAEAGTYDIPVRLSTRLNPLDKLTTGEGDGTKELENGTDYTVDDSGETPVVTIKKEYIEKIKSADKTVIHFVFQENYSTDLTINMGRDEDAFTYTRDFADGIDGFVLKEGNGTVQAQDGKAVLTGNGIFIDENSQESRNNEIEFTFDPASDNMGMGAVLRYAGEDQDYIWVGPVSQTGQHETTWAISTRSGQKASWPDGYFVLADRGKPYKIKVRVVEDVITVFVDDAETYTAAVNGVPVQEGKVGFKSGGTGMSVYEFTQNEARFPSASAEEVTEKTIQSDEMTVTVDEAFPRIIKYDVTGAGTAGGQEKPVYGIELNTKYYVPEVTSEISGNKAVYHLSVDEEGMKASFDVVYTVKGNVLDMRITNIEDDETPIYTFNFPGQCMVSLPSTAENGELRVNNFQSETATPLSELSAENTYKATSIAVLSGGGVAAGINNSSDKNRQEIAYQTFAAGDHTYTGLWSNEYMYRGLDGEIIEEPWTKVSVTGDRNGDGVVDFQDGAIARRDDCYKDGEERLPGSEDVMRSMNMIAMNVASVAQYPFLRIDDNIKKFYLGTDGFGQNIIIKGYQSEGHDAAHPDYANYNKRAGGLTDLKTLIDDAEDFNATIGVHINDTDIYPEAPQYAEKASTLGAWSWYDTSRTINRQKDDLDKSEDGFDGRIGQLFEDTEHKLGTVYVDVFFGTRWPMYKVSDNLQSDGHGVATEYVDEFARTSVFAHHIDNRFDTAGNLVRFVYNQDKDIFGNSRLFRGASDRSSSAGGVGFLGWQGATSYDKTIEAFYTKVLPNKFLGQYPVSQYTTDTQAVLGKNNEVVTKWENNRNVITLNNKTVADGNNIFIPWITGDGEDAQEKIYFWTEDGTHTHWELPSGWDDLANVTLYPLSDQGRGKGTKVRVSGGSVDLGEVDAKQAYVIYKGEEASKVTETAATMNWSTGSLVEDMGFDSHDFENWEKSSSTGSTDHITIANNNLGNSELLISGTEDGKVTQTIDGLTPGTMYSASVWMTTSDDKRASITVDTGTDTVTNYIDDSKLNNGTTHNDKMDTTFQRVSVHFTAESETAVLTLEAAGGADDSAVTRFDDVRVVENELTDKGSHTYYDDFENVDQGYGPFIVTQKADQTHLSEINDKNPEVTTDVIDGRFSLKVRNGNYIRTAPFTVRFQPETTYSAGFAYKVPSGTTGFTVNVKSDETGEVLATSQSVNNGQKSEMKLDFTTGAADDYYIEVTANGGGEYYIDNFWVDESTVVNMDSLQKLYEECALLDESDYTPESYQDLQSALDGAKEVIDKDSGATEEEIAEAYNTLKNAKDALERYASEDELKALQDVIDEMKALKEENYLQDEQWDALQEAISDAEALVESETATAKDTVDMITRLQEAKSSLNYAVDRSALQAAVDKAEAVDQTAMTDGTDLQNFITSLGEAKTALENPEATEADVKAAEEKLTEAYNALVPKDNDQGKKWKESYFAEFITFADGVREEWFSNKSDYGKFVKAIDDAKAAIENKDKNLGDLEEIRTELQEAMDARKDISISLTVSPSEGGTAEGGSVYKAGDPVTLKATAAEGFSFEGWYADGSRLSTDTQYTFKAEKDLGVEARFSKETQGTEVSAPTGLTVSDIKSDSFVLNWTAAEGDNVEGYEIFLDGVSAGTTNETTFKAEGLKPETCYKAEVKAFDADGNYSEAAAMDVTTAQETSGGETEEAYTVDVAVTPEKGGTVSGAGKYKAGETVTLKAEAAEGYVFTGWYSGDDRLSESAEYTFAAEQDMSIEARFAEKQQDTEVAAPTGLKASDITSDSFVLSWTAAEGSSIKGYKVYLDGESLGSTDKTTVKIEHLKPGTAYLVEIRSYDKDGNLSDPVSLKVTTLKDTSGAVTPGSDKEKPAMKPVKTGDSTAIGVLAGAVLASAGVVAGTFRRRKRRISRKRR